MGKRVYISVLAAALVLSAGALAGSSGTSRPDLLVGDKGANWLHGGDGGDAIYGLAGDDVLFGDGGSDQVWGGPGNDVMYGGPGQDTMVGRWGDDRIYTRDFGRDFVHCGAGYDVVIGDNKDVIDVTCDKVVLAAVK
jgi:Ca2+-binding RTX toxin-like protein